MSPEFQSNPGSIVIGVDEAGRGPLAGPVVAAAVVLPQSLPTGVTDSKRLSAKRRGILDEELRAGCHWAVAEVEPSEIDAVNIFQATMLAMTRCVRDVAAGLDVPPEMVLIDGNMTPQGRCSEWCWPARAIVKGDAKEPVIGAASIIAKEWRDRMMLKAAKDHPQYGWERNKGYGTKEHLEALQTYGPTPLHRQSFAPVAQARLL